MGEGGSVRAVRPHLRGHQRDPAQHRRRATAGVATRMRFELDDAQVDAQDTIRKLVQEDDALQRLDEFGAFDPVLVVVTFTEIGNAGMTVPDDRYGDEPALA